MVTFFSNVNLILFSLLSADEPVNLKTLNGVNGLKLFLKFWSMSSNCDGGVDSVAPGNHAGWFTRADLDCFVVVGFEDTVTVCPLSCEDTGSLDCWYEDIGSLDHCPLSCEDTGSLGLVAICLLDLKDLVTGLSDLVALVLTLASPGTLAFESFFDLFGDAFDVTGAPLGFCAFLGLLLRASSLRDDLILYDKLFADLVGGVPDVLDPVIGGLDPVARAFGLLDPAVEDFGLLDPVMEDFGLLDPVMEDFGLLDPVVGDFGLLDPVMEDFGLLDPVVGDFGLLDPVMEDFGLLDPVVGDFGLDSEVEGFGSLDPGTLVSPWLLEALQGLDAAKLVFAVVTLGSGFGCGFSGSVVPKVLVRAEGTKGGRLCCFFSCSFNSSLFFCHSSSC